MASDDALAQNQAGNQGNSQEGQRRRWFGRGSAGPAPTQERENDMDLGGTTTEGVVAEAGNAPDDGSPVGAGGPESASVVDPASADAPTEAPLASEPEVGTIPAPPPEALAALRARGGDDAPVELPLVISIANQKGGVGKTTTAVNLGAALAELEYRVLVIDLDPQGNATTGMGISHRNVEGSIYDVIMNDAPIDDCTEPTTVKNLFVVPANIDLAGAEIELVPAFSRELKLRRALAQVAGSYDFTLIDCPPSLGLLTVNGLAASDDVIVPIQCEYYALEGLGQLLRNVALVKSNLNPALDVRGIVLTMYDARTKLAEQVEREVRAHFGSKVYRTVVPRTVRISEAPSFGQPVTVFDSTSRGALAYRELAKEVSRGAARRSG
ncbi:MAG: chromosome partitioning protein [Actinomycetota bacterium]|nr:chromosome partitioning protein [Actinomycetota bacterium]